MSLACKDIQKSYGVDVILERVSFLLEEKEKMAVVGVNGAGKTTLFQILTRQTSYDGGELYLKKDVSMGYLRQHAQVEGDGTVYEEMEKVFLPVIEAEKTLREMEGRMANLSGAEFDRLMQEYDLKQQEFEKMEGYGYQSRIRGVLKGLGFTETEQEKPLRLLSGGEKTRVMLGKLLLQKPDILLLDEPTNHLDIASISWLEEYLKGYPSAVIVISHDRYFLDKFVTKIVELENKKSTVYEGNYTFYAKQKAIRREVLEKQYENQQKEIHRQEEIIRTLRSFNREKSIKRAESREKALEKMEKLERPEALPSQMHLTLTPQIQSGNDVLSVGGLAKEFPDKILFSHVDFEIKRGEKVAIIGPNGVGKSTLFRILLGEEPCQAGEVRFGVNVHVGYYDQEQQRFDEQKTIFQDISDTYPNLTSGQIRNVLAAFVFFGDDVFKPISALSGGEKGRLMLAKIMLGKANFLMLDEPTNHLDMASKEILEDAINRYEGTVLYISHDRYFINRTAQKVLVLSADGMTCYLGNYDYYLEKTERARREEELFGTGTPVKKKESISASKQDWQTQKEQQARERKIKNRIAKIEGEIEQIEESIAALEKEMEAAASDFQKAQQIFEEKQQLEAKLEELMEQWEAAQG